MGLSERDTGREGLFKYKWLESFPEFWFYRNRLGLKDLHLEAISRYAGEVATTGQGTLVEE